MCISGIQMVVGFDINFFAGLPGLALRGAEFD